MIDRRLFLLFGGLLVYVWVCDAAENGIQAIAGIQLSVCQGTHHGIHQSGEPSDRYRDAQNRYTNCTFIDGNLELSFIDEKDNYDFSFLENIKEITGYVLIIGVNAEYIPLKNLRIIRGHNLYQHENQTYSLYVALNFKPQTPLISGLRELGFTSLHEIMNGDVYFGLNNLLCFHDTINWRDILTGEGAQPSLHPPNPEFTTRECPDCDPVCYSEVDGRRHCWGAGPDQCQNLTRLSCSRQCEGHCFGRQPSECCHPECAGGCTGPYKSNCWACKNFNSDGLCVPSCPPQWIYNPQEYKMVENPIIKYSYGTLCVDECPPHLVVLARSCVKECGDGMIPVDGVCKLCDGPCPKQCEGTGNHYLNGNALGMIGSVESFKDCTIVQGNLQIIIQTFEGYPMDDVLPIHPDNLTLLENIQKITGYLMIEGFVPGDLVDLKFLRNLEVIQGQAQTMAQSSLQIYQTSLETMGLTSLKRIESGNILIAKNSELCFTDTINWDSLLASRDQKMYMQENANASICTFEDAMCDPECSDDGCWGYGPRQCLSCRNYEFEGECINSCDIIPLVHNAPNRTCARCHLECANSCTGPESNMCDSCLHVQDGPYCLAECPPLKYPNATNHCENCHENCADGCTGPDNIIGAGACNSCLVVLMDSDRTVLQCLPPSTETCTGNYFMGQVNKIQACIPCHDECVGCSGQALASCDGCKHYRQSGLCASQCLLDYFPNNVTGNCEPCDQQCRGCTGPKATDCKDCRDRKMYDEPEAAFENPGPEHQFTCVSDCPNDLVAYINRDDITAYCLPETMASEFQEDNQTVTIATVIVVCIIIAIVLIVFLYMWRQRSRSRENVIKLTARMSGLEEGEPLTPTDVKPDMAWLRLIKESELRKGDIIGSGAFGTVFNGVWIPSNENVKIPVAIKVLQEGTSPSMNKELLEEARVMASVDHPCCVRILAVCMTAQMMLITQLMPLGCLLDYVRKHRDNIGSKALLNWCTQIARGMCYLEDKGIVHRDLAARNVLVQSPAQVKITDFGLSKLLDFNEEEYRSVGGKMPIKWLALECIQHRVFTHKSDVWSFGVTVWELFTYGKRPYENVRARDVPDLLEKGERLPQPSICTIDVYMLMIKCWMLDAESRSSFRELADEFSRMARDPGRFLVIQGDNLMRLPNHRFETQDIIQQMNIEGDGPEQPMDAEDYLQPQPTINQSPEVTPVAANPSDRPPDYPGDGGTPHDAAMQPRRVSPMPDAAKDGAKVGKKQRSPPTRDSVSSRYSADPCKLLAEGGDDVDGVPNMPAPPTPVNGGPGGKSGVPLPIDEDDYLQPKSSNHPAYLAVIDGDSNYLGPESSESGCPTEGYLDMGAKPQMAVDNPEYFESPPPPPEVAISMNGLQKHKDPSRLQSTSSESAASDPDYYNEYDQLNQKKSKADSQNKAAGESFV